MSKPVITIHNAQTNELEIREMKTDEFAQWEADQAAVQAEIQAAADLATAKAALLNRLGITEAEAKLLLS